jgi:hypothetical protein
MVEREGEVNLIDSLKKIGELIPAELALRECLRYGVTEIVLVRHPFGIHGSYLDGKIFLNPDMDGKKIARIIRARHGLEITEAEAPVWIFYHELGHHVLRSDDQMAAERWALEKFMEWRVACRDS